MQPEYPAQPGYPPGHGPPGYDPRAAYPPGYGYAPVAPPPPPPVESPTPYHRLFRTNPRYAWWRPLVAVAVFAVFFLIAQVLVSIVWIVAVLATGSLRLEDLASMTSLMAEVTDVSNPLNLFLLLGTIAVMLPLVPLAMLCAGIRPVGMRHSVAFRIRWRWMAWCAIPSLVVTVVSISLSFVPLLFGETLEPVAVDPGTVALLAVLIVLLAPLQAAAEEYVFRGLIMQTMGAWVRSVWPGIIVSTVIFTVGHTQYELWGMLSVGVMGVGFAIVAWRTGGLEAGIAFHTVNNVLALLLLASGATGTTVMGSEGSGPLAPLLQLVLTAGFVLWVEFAARRKGIARARELTPTSAPPAPPAAWPAA